MKILVVEDEHLVAQRLIRLIQTCEADASIHWCDAFSKANSYLDQVPIDVLFLDLNLHGKDGFHLLNNYLNASFQTIVVSAYVDNALAAFEYGVLDFVAKPFTLERVCKALNRVKDQKTNMATTATGFQLCVRTKGQVALVRLQDVLYFQANGIYSTLHLKDGKQLIYDKPLNQLLSVLPSDYLRIHKSFAVRKSDVIRIRRIRHNAYHAELQSGCSIPISRAMRKSFVSEPMR